MKQATAAATALAAFSVLCSTAQAQEFDATHCYAGIATAAFSSDDAMAVNFEHKGIYRANGEKKLLHGFSIHCVGTVVRIKQERPQRGGCKVVDPKGDEIHLVFEGSGPVGKQTGTADAVGGTGAWKGVSGGGKWEVHTPARPVVPGTFQGCLRYHGAFRVAK